MAGEQTDTKQRPMRVLNMRLLIAAALIIASALTFVAIDRFAERRALGETQQQALNDSAILASGLQAELDKFSLVPLVLADGAQMREMLAGDASAAPVLNRRFEAIARQSRAAALYLMDAQGNTLAASNWDQPDSFVGSNYAFREYFTRALAEGSATQFALGTVSQRPGLYIAQRVGSAGEPLGVVAVKVEFDALESSWRKATPGVYITDASGLVLITSQPSWRFATTRLDLVEQRDAEADKRRFGIDRPSPLVIRSRQGQALVEVPLLDTEQPLAPSGWVLHLLADPSPRIAAAKANGRLALLLLVAFALLAMAAVWLLQRRREAQANTLLTERTSALREQLLQANRLATLGQISAGISHEISQPLAAIRVFAESGQKMLARADSKGAGSNLSRIVDLTDRIAQITGELRNFSRRQLGPRRPMALGEAVDGAVLLLRDRIARMGIICDLPDEEDAAIVVVAEHVRLEQVLVNLLQNAIDAVGDIARDAAGQTGRITITATLDPDTPLARLSVIDNGAGITAKQAENLFQPFATSKPDGLGLGLVISRDIMRDLGGELSFEPTPSGTCFTMHIPRKP